MKGDLTGAHAWVRCLLQTSSRSLLFLLLGLLGQVLGAPPGTKPGTAPLSRLLLRMKRVDFLQLVASG